MTIRTIAVLALALLPGLLHAGGSVLVGAADFRSLDGFRSYFNLGGGHITANPDSADAGCLIAPIELPHQAQVTQMDLYYLDNNPSFNLGVRLLRIPRLFNSTTHLLLAVSTGAEPGMRVATDTNDSVFATINNNSFVYYLQMGHCMHQEQHRLYAVRVSWEFDAIFSNGFQLSAPPPLGQERHVIPAAAFRMASSSFAHGFGVYSSVFTAGPVGDCPAVAPVQLPHGAVIRDIRADTLDRLDTGALTLALRRRPLAGGLITLLATLESTGTSVTPLTTVTVTNSGSVVDNSQFMYWITYCMPATEANNLGVQRVEITYDLP